MQVCRGVRRAAAAAGWRALSTGAGCDDGIFDVAVVGGGVMGVWAAISAAKQGVSVVLLDRFKPGHERGSSHGDGRIYRLAYEEDHYVDMMKHSLPCWRELQEFAGQPLMAQTGGLNMNTKGCPKIVALRKTYDRHGITHEDISAESLPQRFPQFRVETDQEVLYQPDYGVLFATKCITAGWQYAESLGAVVGTDFVLDSLTPTDGDGVMTLGSDDGHTVQAQSVVLAPGSWITPLAKKLFEIDIATRVSAETVCFYRPKTDPVSAAIDHSYKSMPVFIPDVDNGLGLWGYYGLPMIDVPGIKASAHYCGPTVDPDARPASAGGPTTLEAESEAAAARQVQAVIETTNDYVRTTFPHVEPEPFMTQNCLYTTTPDHDYILGQVRGWPSVVLCGGGSGHAFKMGPAIGDCAAALALGQEPPLDITRFRLERLAGLSETDEIMAGSK